jgi:hypothetical protein
MERVAVDVALLLRRNLERSRVLMLLMPASTQRKPSASRFHEDTRHGGRSAGCTRNCLVRAADRQVWAIELSGAVSAMQRLSDSSSMGTCVAIVMQNVQRKAVTITVKECMGLNSLNSGRRKRARKRCWCCSLRRTACLSVQFQGSGALRVVALMRCPPLERMHRLLHHDTGILLPLATCPAAARVSSAPVPTAAQTACR